MAVEALLGAISGGASIAGNIVQGVQQDLRDREARNWQEKMFNKSNAYNHPASVMMRLKQAGLNPNLVAGQPVQGAASVPSASQGSRAPSYDDIAPNVVNAIMQSEQLRLQKEETAANIENQRRLTDAEIALKEAEKNEIISRTPKDDAPTIAERTQSESDSSVALQGSQKKSLDDENARTQEEYNYQKTLRSTRERILLADANASESKANISKVEASYVEERIKSELATAKAQRSEIYKRVELIGSQKELTDSQQAELADTLYQLNETKQERLQQFKEQIANGRRISAAQVRAAEENSWAIASRNSFLRRHYMKYDDKNKMWYVPSYNKMDFERVVFGSSWLDALQDAQNVYEHK